MLHLFGKEIVE